VQRYLRHCLLAWCNDTSILWMSSKSLVCLVLDQSPIERWHWQQCYVCLICTQFCGQNFSRSSKVKPRASRFRFYVLYTLLIFVATSCL
jgi:hypothetical protein